MWTIPDPAGATEDELSAGARQIRDELQRRRFEAEMPARIDAMIGDFITARDSADRDEPATWVAPTGAHDAYPIGWVVTHDGKTWESLRAGNPDEPGVASWREITGDDTHAAWVQPTGAHDAYPRGAVVTHQDRTWTSDLDGNVWTPGEFGWTAS